MIKAVLIDVDDTLLDFPLCSQWAMEDAAAQFGLRLPEGFFPIFNDINNSLWARLERKEITSEELFAVRWNMIFQKVGIDFDGPTFEKAFLANMGRSHALVEGAEDLLAYLSAKYDVYVASNSRRAHQLGRMKLAGLYTYFKDFFVSESIGHPKPAPEFFAVCMERAGVGSKDELIMIGDSLSADIAGACAFGIPSCWFNKYKKPLPDGLCPTHTVERLADIKAIL